MIPVSPPPPPPEPTVVTLPSGEVWTCPTPVAPVTPAPQQVSASHPVPAAQQAPEAIDKPELKDPAVMVLPMSPPEDEVKKPDPAPKAAPAPVAKKQEEPWVACLSPRSRAFVVACAKGTSAESSALESFKLDDEQDAAELYIIHIDRETVLLALLC